MHVNIHYFERPFRCDACAVSFRTRGHLQKHKRSVSHFNRVNMNLTFGTPTADNPRPFKCDDCKIAFRIHGHLAKHLRSKMHIMKLECLGKLPFGMYAELERSGVNLNEIDTTDCENSLESLQVLAQRLYQQEASTLSWKEAGGSGEGGSEPEDDGLETPLPPMQQALGLAPTEMIAPTSVDAINSHNNRQQQQTFAQTRPTDPQSTLPSTGSVPNQMSHIPLHVNASTLHDLQGGHGPQMQNPVMGPPSHEYLECSPQQQQQQQMMPQQSLVNPLMLSSILHQQSSLPHGPPSAQQAIPVQQLPPRSAQIDTPRSSCTCHICGKVLKSAKSLQVHLHTEHADEQQSKTPAPSFMDNNVQQFYEPHLYQHQMEVLNEGGHISHETTAHMTTTTTTTVACHLCNKPFQNHMLLQQVRLP